MEVLQGMSVDRMVIIFPSVLVAMYLILQVQKSLSGKDNFYLGLIIPVICFVASTVLAVRPLIISDSSQYDGLVLFCLRMWATFNIATAVFLVPYIRERRLRKLRAEAEIGETEVPEASQNLETLQDEDANQTGNK